MKKKRKPCHTQMGAYKKFLFDLNEIIELTEFNLKLQDIPNEFRRKMYDSRVRIPNPEAANSFITSKELKRITQKAKEYYRSKPIKNDDKALSPYQLMLLSCYGRVMTDKFSKEIGDKNHPEYKGFKHTGTKILETFHTNFFLCYFRMIVQLGRPDYKYYGLNIRWGTIWKDSPYLELVTELHGVPAESCKVKINGILRPAFRLGNAVDEINFEWISIDKSLIHGFYTGKKQKLDVYIQSHALKRLEQRLDLLNQESRNYVLWENTNDIVNFEVHKGYLLLPVMVYEVKLGYLMANIVGDKLLFRTFLFITHNCTPEGDKLRKISGLGKEDIVYWKIDRLSTFLNLDEQKHSALFELFKKAGLEDLIKLKDKDFHIDEIQTDALDGLLQYIEQGKLERELYPDECEVVG